MRRAPLIFAAVVVVATIVIVVLVRPEILSPLGIGGDTAKLRALSRQFIEDIQFKDFNKAASYHAPDERDTVDIPFLLERLFVLKPEQLDIIEHEILLAEVDSTGLRGRTKSRVKAKDLLREKLLDRELMLYFYRANKEAPWFMRLESSLRRITGDPDKKH